jgi:hypothetical protein
VLVKIRIMATLRELVLEVQEAAVVEGIARFYDQRETQWLPDAVADVLGQLRKLAPNPAGFFWMSYRATESFGARKHYFSSPRSEGRRIQCDSAESVLRSSDSKRRNMRP